MRKAVVVQVDNHRFYIGEVVTQVAERDEDGHLPFQNDAGVLQYLDDEDIRYIDEVERESEEESN